MRVILKGMLMGLSNLYKVRFLVSSERKTVTLEHLAENLKTKSVSKDFWSYPILLIDWLIDCWLLNVHWQIIHAHSGRYPIWIRMTIADAGSEFIELMFPRYINQKKRIATSWSRMVVSILTGDLEILFHTWEWGIF